MFALRLALVIFALWVLVVEPTFSAFEQMERQSSEFSGSDALADSDQLIPPGHLIAPHWVNQHHPLSPTLPLPELADSSFLFHPTALAVARSPLPVELCMPYPPSALPLRL